VHPLVRFVQECGKTIEELETRNLVTGQTGVNKCERRNEGLVVLGRRSSGQWAGIQQIPIII